MNNRPNHGDENDYRITNFQHLRVEAIERCWTAPLEKWDVTELRAIGRLIGRHSKRQGNRDWQDNPCMRMIARDTEEHQIPKWACVVSWLTPEGAMSHAPELVAEIAAKALNCELAPPKSDY